MAESNDSTNITINENEIQQDTPVENEEVVVENNNNEETPLLHRENEPNFDDPTNYYAILGVDKDVTPSQAKKAYYKLSRQYHPDKNNDPRAAEIFMMVNKAYVTLSDPHKKSLYDEFGHSYEQNEGMFEMFTTVFDKCGTCISFTVFIIAFLFVLPLDVWIVLFCLKLDVYETWLYSLVNIPLYIIILYLIQNNGKTMLSTIVMIVSNLILYGGIICFFVKLDYTNENHSFHIWMIPLYVYTTLSAIAKLLSECMDYKQKSINISDSGETTEISIDIKRTTKQRIVNAILVIVEALLFATVLFTIGECGDSLDNNASYIRDSVVVYCVFNIVYTIFIDWQFNTALIVASIIRNFIYIVSVIFFCNNMGSKHHMLYTYSLLPVIITISILNIVTVVLPFLVGCCILPKLKEEAVKMAHTN